jgi:hypothetical protein
MPVSTRDEQPPPEPGQFDDAFVFAPATGSVKFKGVQESDVTLQESPEDLRVSLPPHAVQIPEGMVKDQEHLPALVQHRKQFTELNSGLVARVCAEIGHNRLRPAARQIVDSEMKYGSFERDAPLECKRDLTGIPHHSQQGRR